MAKPARKQTAPGYADLRAAVKNGDISRLYVLTGDETFLMERFLLLLEQTLIRPESVTLDKVAISAVRTGSRLTIDRVRSEVMAPPFLSNRRLVIVRQSGWFAPARGAGDDGEEAEDGDDAAAEPSTSEPAARPSAAASRSNAAGADLPALLERLPDSVCLVFCEQKVDRRLKSLMTAVQQAGTIGVFEPEQPATLVQWIEAECRHRALRIDPATAGSLVDRCDGSMQVIWNELSKLFLHAAGSGQPVIDQELLEKLSLPDLRGTIFDLTDAISAGRTAQALSLLDALIAQRQPVQLITFMLARHFRQLMAARALGAPDEVASRLKVMPFVAARLLSQSRGLSLETLEAQYLACFEADLAVKTGRIADRLALETLLVAAAEEMRRRKGTATPAAAPARQPWR